VFTLISGARSKITYSGTCSKIYIAMSDVITSILPVNVITLIGTHNIFSLFFSYSDIVFSVTYMIWYIELKLGRHPVAVVQNTFTNKQYIEKRGTAVAQWLSFCATNRKVAGSIPDCVIGFFR
jgi:hypothetical protein